MDKEAMLSWNTCATMEYSTLFEAVKTVENKTDRALVAWPCRQYGLPSQMPRVRSCMRSVVECVEGDVNETAPINLSLTSMAHTCSVLLWQTVFTK